MLLKHPLIIITLCILAGCTKATIPPPSSEVETIIENSGVISSVEIESMSMLDKLSHIQREGIKIAMMDADGLSAASSGEERYLLGDIGEWKKALSTPCTSTPDTDMRIFTPTFDGDTPVPREYYCTTLTPEENSKLVERFVSRFQTGAIESPIPIDEYNPIRVQSSFEGNPSYPHTPLEIFVTTHSLRYINAVVRVVAIRQYGEGLLILSAGAQEPGLPGYSITHIYRDGDTLYLTHPKIVDIARMDMAYGTGFTLDLLNLAYEAVDNSKTDSGVTALLKGDFVTVPSIINQRIQDKLIEEFYNIR